MKKRLKEKIVLLGAGLAGLSAGYFLVRNGYKVVIIEKEKQVGGLAKTIKYQGYRFDLGGHRWFSKSKEVNKFIKKIVGKDLVEVRRVSRIIVKDKFYDYPIKMKNVLKNFGPIKSFGVFLDYLYYKLNQHKLDKATFEGWIKSQFGNQLYKFCFKDYTEKVWGINCQKLSSEFARQRIKGLSLFSVLGSALLKKRNDSKSLIERFIYPKYGIGQISENLAQKIKKHGGKIILGKSIKKTIAKNNKISRVVLDDDSAIAGDIFISTIPINYLLNQFRPAVNKNISASTQKLKFRDLITVNLIIKKKQITSDTWLYLQDKKYLLGRIHEPKNWSKDMVKDKNYTSLVCEIWCFKDEQIWQEKDQKIMQRITGELQKAHILSVNDTKKIKKYFITRVENAYPIYKLGYEKYLAKTVNYLLTFKNLYLCGRSGTYQYNNMDHSIMMGKMVVENIIHDDQKKFQKDLEYLEELR